MPVALIVRKSAHRQGRWTELWFVPLSYLLGRRRLDDRPMTGCLEVKHDQATTPIASHADMRVGTCCADAAWRPGAREVTITVGATGTLQARGVLATVPVEITCGPIEVDPRFTEAFAELNQAVKRQIAHGFGSPNEPSSAMAHPTRTPSRSWRIPRVHRSVRAMRPSRSSSVWATRQSAASAGARESRSSGYASSLSERARYAEPRTIAPLGREHRRRPAPTLPIQEGPHGKTSSPLNRTCSETVGARSPSWSL
jgi:hypothetical protein